MKNHVIIFGCGRSGTSILGELFEHIDGYDYHFEAMLDEIKRYDFSRNRYIAVKVPKSAENDRSPGLACNIDKLIELLPPNHKFIFIVRHPLDAICSLKPGIQADWGHNPKPPNYETLLNEKLVIKCAHHWNYINDAGYKLLSSKEKLLVVKYEDLVLRTCDTVTTILKYIGADLDVSSLSDYISKIQDSTANSYHAKKQIVWYREDHNKRVNRWKNEILKEELALSELLRTLVIQT